MPCHSLYYKYSLAENKDGVLSMVHLKELQTDIYSVTHKVYDLEQSMHMGQSKVNIT